MQNLGAVKLRTAARELIEAARKAAAEGYEPFARQYPDFARSVLVGDRAPIRWQFYTSVAAVAVAHRALGGHYTPEVADAARSAIQNEFRRVHDAASNRWQMEGRDALLHLLRAIAASANTEDRVPIVLSIWVCDNLAKDASLPETISEEMKFGSIIGVLLEAQFAEWWSAHPLVGEGSPSGSSSNSES